MTRSRSGRGGSGAEMSEFLPFYGCPSVRDIPYALTSEVTGRCWNNSWEFASLKLRQITSRVVFCSIKLGVSKRFYPCEQAPILSLVSKIILSKIFPFKAYLNFT